MQALFDFFTNQNTGTEYFELVMAFPLGRFKIISVKNNRLMQLGVTDAMGWTCVGSKRELVDRS